MDNEFHKVTRKKWLTRKYLSRKVQSKNISNYNNNADDINVEDFLKKVRSLCLQMENNDYFIQATETIKEVLNHTPTISNISKINEYGVKRLVCFGLGPFTYTIQALHQLAFILTLQKVFLIPEAIYYDPVFGQKEKLILEHLKCNVMTENCEGKYFADIKTIFFLPHCSNSLTNKLLWYNWNRDNLNNVILINNSFESLICNKPNRLLCLDSEYIMRIQPYTEEKILHDDYKIQNIFNDLSVHMFQLKKLPSKESSFWKRGDEPMYNDAELLRMEDFNKLSL